MTKTLCRLFAGALLLTLVAPARARAEAIAVLGVEAEGVSEAQANQLAEALRTQAKQTAGVRFLPSKDFMEMKFLYNCMDPTTIASCLAPAGKSVGADKLVFGSLTLTRKKRVRVSIKLVDVRSGMVVKFVDEEVQTLDAAGSAPRWFAALVPSQAPPVVVTPPPPQKGQIVVSSDPSDATVTIDGKRQPNTPTTVPVVPGAHSVVVSKSGFDSETRSIFIKPGESDKVDVTLKAKPADVVAHVDNPPPPFMPPPPAATADHPGRVAMAVGGVALAVAVVGAGIAIYTFKHYSDLQTTSREDLNRLRDNALNSGPDGVAWVNGNKTFFEGKPTCDVPGSMLTIDGPAVYHTHCSEGNTYATVTTVLDIAVGVLAATGVVLLGIGGYAARHADQPKVSLAPRLRIVSPTVTRNGGGLSAAFEF